MKQAFGRSTWWSGTPNTYEYKAPLQLFVQQVDIEVATAKPSEIQVGSNINTVLANLESKFNTIQQKMYTWDYDYNISFTPGSSGITYDETSYTFLFAGTMKDLVQASDSTTIRLTRIYGSGAIFASNSQGHMLADFTYSAVVNDNTADASFRQIKYIVYDKYTHTIKSINNSEQTVSEDEAQIVINAVVQGPQLANITSQVHDNQNLTPSYVKITDSDIGSMYCYIGNDKPFYKPSTNSGAAVGLFYGSDGRNLTFNYINNGSDMYVHLSYHDITKAVRPTIYAMM